MDLFNENDPFPTKIPLYTPALNIPNTVDSINYDDQFNFNSLDPEVGQIFQIYVSHRYISFHYPPIEENCVYGSTFYAPQSDLAAIIFHSGCLFIHAKLKTMPLVRFSTIKNFYETMIVPDSEYSKVAVVLDLPTDLQIQGVNLRIYIDQSPALFPSTIHNNYESKEIDHIEKYSIRIVDYSIITMYDEPPHLVSIDEYQRQSAIIPIFKSTFTEEIGIEFSPQIFIQIMSRFNLVRNMFDYFFFLFDVCNDRYEILHTGGTKFSILRVIHQINSDTVRIPNVDENHSLVINSADITEFGVKQNLLMIKGIVFSPISALLLIPKV